MKKFLLIAGVAGLVGIGCLPKDRFVTVAEKTLPKTVTIEVESIVTALKLTPTKDGFRIDKATMTVVYTGSGVIISPGGHILTCQHLFDEKVVSIKVRLYNKSIYSGELLYTSAHQDLGLIKIKPLFPLTYAEIADPASLAVGQEVISIGSPLGLDFTVTAGIISALDRREEAGRNSMQSDAAINPGNSGGPVFNLQGELVGINSFLIPPVNAPIFTGLGFSVQADEIISFLRTFAGLPQ